MAFSKKKSAYFVKLNRATMKFSTEQRKSTKFSGKKGAEFCLKSENKIFDFHFDFSKNRDA